MPIRRVTQSMAIAVMLAGSAACGSAPAPTTPAVDPPTPPPQGPFRGQVGPGNTVFLAAPPRAADTSGQPIVGRYALEIAVQASSGFRCETVPAHLKTRSYVADIDPFRDYYAIKLYGATFLKNSSHIGYGCTDARLEMGGVCHQFILRPGDGETVSIEMQAEDEWRGSEIWEVLTQEGRLLQLHARATGTARADRIVATGSGGLWYGDGLPASTSAGCGQGPVTLTFTRQ